MAEHDSSESLQERVREVLEVLYPAALGTSTVARYGIDSLHTAMARMWAMDDALKLAFLEYPPGRQKAHILKAVYNNFLQELRWYRLPTADILPDTDADTTAPDPAEVVEREQFIAMLIKMARKAMTKKQRSVFELWLKDMEHAEIAEALGISVEVSRQRLFDGLARTAKAAKKHGVS